MHRRHITFLYDLGQTVIWAEDWARYTVVYCRWTERDLLGPVVEYLIQHAAGRCAWAYEPDLLPVREEH